MATLRIHEAEKLELLAQHGGITQSLLRAIYINKEDVLYREDRLGDLKPVGHITEGGYLRVKLFGKLYMVHRFIWCWHTGIMLPPEQELDHINHDKLDNSIANLRVVDRQAQMRNKGLAKSNTTGVIGVAVYKPGNNYRAYIRNNDNKIEHLGYAATVEDAAKLRKAAEIRLGYHLNHGTLPVPPTT